MQLLKTISLSALVAFVAAQSDHLGKVGEHFGLVTIKSGSNLQYATVTIDGEGHLGVGSGSEFDGVFVAGNRVRVGDDKYLGVGEDGSFQLSDNGSTFFVDDNNLVVDGSSSFVAVPKGDGYEVKKDDSSSDAVGVLLYVSYSSGSSSSSAASNGTETTATTAAPAPGPTGKNITTVTATCHECQEGGKATSTIPQVNGAAATAVGYAGALAAGVAGALFL